MKLTLKVEYELPVLPKQISKTHTLAGRKLTPFIIKDIRLKENGKTDKNTMDTVMGCKGGCWGCYAEGSQGTLGGAIKFDAPTSQILRPSLLQGDSLRHLLRVSGHASDLPKRWIRCGVMGDPSYDWELTTRAAETVSMTGTRMVIITKFWKMPTEEQLARLALSGAIFHWSVIAGYDWTEEFDQNSRVPEIVDLLNRYQSINAQESVYMRICTFPWHKGQPLKEGMGAILHDGQEAFYDLSVKHSIRVIETPWRFRKSDPRVMHMDESLFMHPKSYINLKNGIKNEDGSAKLTTTKIYGGPRYFNDEHALTESEAHVIGCVTDCPSCPNQCGATSNATRKAIVTSTM